MVTGDDDRALSITAAAMEDGERIALVDDEGVIDVRAAAARTFDSGLADARPALRANGVEGHGHGHGGASGACAVVARAGRETVMAIWRAFEQRRPLGLVHAATTEAERAALIARLAAAPVPPDTLAVVFTSGSTGRPKGVVLSRTAALAAAGASAAHLGWRDDDRWLLALPLAHVGGLAVVVRCLVARKPVIATAGGLDGARLAGAIVRHRATLASLVPAQLDALLAVPGWCPPPHLRAVLLGGAAAPASLVARALDRGVPVLTTYGASETFGQIATASLAAPAPPGAVGRPLPGFTVTAGTAAAPAPITVVTAARLTGYLDDPSPPPGPLVTADLGYLDNGWLHVVGRADDVIITGGENVHPAAVEAALLACPGVAAAVVFGVPDPRWGQIVAAAIVPTAAFDRARMLAEVAARLPRHAWPRRSIEVASLPLTASGKIDRRRARLLVTATD